MRHAFRNALIPLATIVAFDISGIIGGAVITETVFEWEGMGRLFIDGLREIDPNPVMAFFVVDRHRSPWSSTCSPTSSTPRSTRASASVGAEP